MRGPRLLGMILIVALVAGCACRRPARSAATVAPARLDLTIGADGVVSAAASSTRRGLTFMKGRLDAEDVEATDRSLRDVLELAAAVAGCCGSRSDAVPPVHLTVAPTAPWKHVLWVMQVLESPRVRLWRLRIRLGEHEEYVNADLPAEDVLERMLELELEAERTDDWSAYDAYVNPDALKVRLFRKRKDEGHAAFTRIRAGAYDARAMDLSPAAEPDPKRDEAVWVAMRQTIEAGRRDHPARIGEIRTRPPNGPAVPAGDVVRVLRMFRAAGYTEVRFEAATVPTTDVPKIGVSRGPMGDS